MKVGLLVTQMLIVFMFMDQQIQVDLDTTPDLDQQKVVRSPSPHHSVTEMHHSGATL